VFATCCSSGRVYPCPCCPAAGLRGAGRGRRARRGPLFRHRTRPPARSRTLWYFAGWVYGRRIMRLLCLVSLSRIPAYGAPRGTSSVGASSHCVGQFVPGLSRLRAAGRCDASESGLFRAAERLGSACGSARRLAPGCCSMTRSQPAGALADLGSLAGALIGVLACGLHRLQVVGAAPLHQHAAHGAIHRR